MYIAIGLVILCIALGIVEIASINYSSDRCLSNFDKIENEIENENFGQAEKICNKTADEYENITSKIMFCYYSHSNLETISQNLAVMAETLRNQDIQRYKALCEKTKEQLNAIKEEELFNIQNIL